MDHRGIRSVIVLAALVACGAATGQDAPRIVRGSVAALDGANLTVKAATGESVAIRLPDKPLISVRAPSSLDAIKAGDYVGTTAAPRGDGTLLASEVHIFPESMRHVGEGHRPMARVPGSTMTNATVAAVTNARPASTSTMTNATVSNVAGSGGTRTLKLQYPGGEQTVAVPPDVPVVTTEQGDRSALVPGAQVLVVAAAGADGTLTAERISVGKNGSVPPI
jgi:uncharacterized protein DUF5666